MKNITLQDPRTKENIKVEMNAEEVNQQQGWRITFQDGNSAVLGLDQHRIWKQFDGNDLDSELINIIGKAIESQENPNY
jgi:hypothetical protein